MVPALLKSGGDLRPAIMKLAPGIVAATAVALYSALSIHLTGTLTPWTKRDADLVESALPSLAPASPPSPALAALRKNLTKLARRTNVAPAYAEDLAGATAFYGAHSGPLLWLAESGISERGNAVIAEIRKADDWGLRARDFALPQLPAGANSPEAAAAAEVEVTFAVLKYARFARGGRFSDPSSISKLLDYTPPVHAPKDVLADIAASDAPDAYLRSLHPRHAQFEALRRLLLKLRGRDAGAGEIAYGEKLQTVMPQLVRSETPGWEASTSVEPEREGADKTLRIGRILVNMERWRWLPVDLGEFHVWNNVPEFLTRVVRNGEIVHSDRIVAGQPDWPTPAFSADMKMIVFHPSWGVPDGIKRKELWPLLRNSSGGDLIRTLHRVAIEPGRARTAQAASLLPRPSDRSQSSGLEQCEYRRVRLPPAAGAGERARRDQVHVPQQARRLHARHAAARSLRETVPGLEPRLHARGKSEPACRGPSRAGQGLVRAAGGKPAERGHARGGAHNARTRAHDVLHGDGRPRGELADFRRSLWCRYAHGCTPLRQESPVRYAPL